MKKSLGVVLLVFLFSASAFAAGGKLIFNLYGDCMSLPANNYTGQAKQYKIFYEAKAAYLLVGNLYVWGSHGYFPLNESWADWSSKNAFTQDINVERTVAKRIIAGGLGFFAGYLREQQLAIRAEIGICSIANTIDKSTSDITTNALLSTETVRQAGIGLRANLAFTYGLYKNIFGELAIGYMHAADTIDNISSSLGGWHLQLGLGINL
ncbi:MAG: hypothetical protein NTW95_08940 [Candidatus Aminicenantes bacterium]|nr:hypothetical protein [Candidatus Aminicenantes bacterium]